MYTVFRTSPAAVTTGVKAVIEKAKVPVLPIFQLMQKVGNIPEHDMFNTFNMGTGLVIAVAPDKADEAVRVLNAAGESAVILGEVQAGETDVELW